MKKIFGLTLLVSFMILITGCSNNKTSDKILAAGQEELMNRANAKYGMPNIENFTQRGQLKMIQELCDKEKLICYCYIFNQYNNTMKYMGKCIGFGIPAATQYTNPVKTVNKSSTYGVEQLPQADPNGLFMPTSTEATWVLLLDSKTGEVKPAYFEERVIILTHKWSEPTE